MEFLAVAWVHEVTIVSLRNAGVIKSVVAAFYGDDLSREQTTFSSGLTVEHVLSVDIRDTTNTIFINLHFASTDINTAAYTSGQVVALIITFVTLGGCS